MDLFCNENKFCNTSRNEDCGKTGYLSRCSNQATDWTTEEPLLDSSKGLEVFYSPCSSET